jgi:ketosteroid isomerase-like protein
MERAASFEEAKGVVRGVSDALNRRDLDAALEFLAEDVEYVTRDGPGRGREAFRDVWAPQLDRFHINVEVEEIVDAGNGQVIVVQKVDRLDPETEQLELRAWPAVVVRVKGGKVVFYEGYQDRRKAFSDLGLEPE